MNLNQPRAMEMMEHRNLDGIIVSTARNLSYAMDFPSPGVEVDAFGILPRSEQIPPTLVLAHRAIVTLAANPSWIKNILTYEHTAYVNLFPSPGTAFDQLVPTTPEIESEMRRILKEAKPLPTNDPLEGLALGIRQLGLDKSRLGFDDLELGEELKERHLPGITITGARGLLNQIKLVKTPEEVQKLRASAKSNHEALLEALSVAREGADVSDVATAFRMAVTKRGGTPAPNGGYLTGSAERGLAPVYHHKMKRGDVMFSGAVSTYNAYYSDFVRTMVVGPPTPGQVATHKLVESTFDQLESVIKPGINSIEVGRSITQTIAREGGDVNKLALNIHSMGQDIVELAHHIRQDGFPLESNVCFCVYVLYKDPSDGQVFSIEHNYIVTKDGHEVLEKMPHDLIEVS